MQKIAADTWNCGPPHAPGQLEIDLGALAANYHYLAKQASPAHIAAVVKANGYGLGIEPVSYTLAQAGCRVFFTAHLDEAITLRAIFQKTAPTEVFHIGVLNGVLHSEEPLYNEYDLFPVLNSLDQIDQWRHWLHHQNTSATLQHATLQSAALQIDTGMNRLGLSSSETDTLLKEQHRLKGIPLRFLMSHMACADTPDHPLNQDQFEKFTRVKKAFPQSAAMLSASSASFLGPNWCFDYIRPGVALYGGRPNTTTPSPLHPVVSLKARILQIRDVQAGETIGYGASYRAKTPTKIATVGIGYADGYLRMLSNKATAKLNTTPINLVGRVSMDVSTFDVTHIEKVTTGDWVTLLDDAFTIDDLADQADTIGYEVLTSLGSRYRRLYKGL